MTKFQDVQTPYITLVEQASTPDTPASGNAKLYRGTDNKQYVIDDTGAVAEVGGSSGGGSGILACTAYNPGTISTYTTTSTTIADIDGTNLTVTFTAPASGKVLISAQAAYNSPNKTSPPYTSYLWGLREGSTTLLEKIVHAGTIAPNGADIAGYVEFVITGLTPGSSHTYKLAHRVDVSGVTAKLYAGGIAGQAIMKAVALP